ncbi:FHA modulated ABC efflux pump with fused ATPase and integral membrane subunit [Actinomycetospora succinea]|uniref:FHA modulated ABC efflux pump with fused ATPase and integral membrane subunit n=1 Tax=Actinomycetospora succinea TaxID=663603 RepID=A0A4R6V9G0_9PSEU|nr:ATP-binding cassette domain-containing protein [Actinomycetospora succinea]TDQ58323.1 FHA modulated ABC efflux pump with fused ATPase and integral membrane subunit [Actinomycetospora succinea]
MAFDPVRAAPVASSLEIRAGGRHRTLHPGESLVVGRDEASDLQLVGPRVSREHLLIRSTPAGWQIVDRSRNGSFAGGRPFREITVSGPVTVRLGDAAGPELHAVAVPPRPAPPGPERATVTVPAAARSSAQGRLSAVHRLAVTADLPRSGPEPVTPRVRIGRADDNDVVVHDLLVSRHHADLVRRPDGGWDIVDLGSPNGTFVDGARVRRAPVGPASVVGIGHALFHLDGDRLVEHVDTGDIGFRADGLVVREGDKTLLSGVGFSLGSRSLLAVVGPSGAGKSTLLRALTGFRPADEGVVEYAGRDLYTDYDELRQRIGLVPQDDILHPQLTVRRALAYAARLRFPTDVAAADRDRRIEEVIGELGLTGQADQRIDCLSGGQRKRTSVALELLTRPSLLFLDEPTSGLDPGLDKSVMHTLRGLADDGRTVVVVTHNVANLDVCDRLLLLAPGGTVAYFGPPQEALTYFGVTDFADLFLLLDREKHVDWADRYRRSPQWARYVGAPDAQRRPGVHATAPAPRQQPVLTQFAVLCRRYLAVVLADRQYTIFMAALPLLLAALTHALPGDTGLSQAAQARGTPGNPNSLLLVFVVGAALMGSAAAIREVVKEREIYRRERAIGLSRGAYLASKLTVLLAITGVQAVLLGVLGMIGRPAPDEAVLLGSGAVEIVVALLGVTVASMALGLAVSAAITNADRGMPLLVLLAMLQFILSSALLQIQSSPVLAQLSWLVPARWGFAMGASTIGIPSGPGLPTPYREHDPLWDHDAATWLLDFGALVGLTVLFALLTAVLLRRIEPIRSGRRR